MTLDRQVCSQARLTRDPRFDGKFFTGVLSTRIYCRTICPVPTVKEKNVIYFQTAAAASESGYRPCLRCRPECSPGTPAWSGTSNTVSRALRLIEESGMEDGGMESLAERLGVSSRHLRRLFIRHLGASPSAVAKTRRLHFAKKLIDETSLSMTDVAHASGFGCVRRFNDVISKTYKRTPTHIRRLVKQQQGIQPQDHYNFQLRYRPPYHWTGMLAYLGERAIPGVEVADQKGYRRTISVNGCDGYFDVSPDEQNNAVALSIQIGDPRYLYLIIERIRTMFDLNADWAAIAASLGTDPALGPLIRAEPGRRVAGCWSGFEISIQAILSQDNSSKKTAAIMGQLVESYGQRTSNEDGPTHLFPTPERVVRADLTTIGLGIEAAEAIHALARTVCEGTISFERVVDSDTLVTQLREIAGIDRATAEYISMRTLGDPDVLKINDSDLLCILGLKTSGQLKRRSEAWRPWRSYASLYLGKGESA